MKKIKRALTSMVEKINTPMGFIADAVTIFLVFATENTIFRHAISIVAIIYMVIIIGYMVKSLFDTDRAEQELNRSYMSSQIKLSMQTHSYFHNLRNYIASISLEKTKTYEDTQEKCKSICNYITEFYNTLFEKCLNGSNISTCIKLIKPESIFDENYLNWQMTTIARSTSTVQKRNNIDDIPVSISANTDFQIVISEKYQDDLFSFADMTHIKQDFWDTYGIAYQNSRGDKFLDYYRSTIVVPIKIDGRYASGILKSYTKNSDQRSFVLGFLCMDSMKTFETDEEKAMFALGVEYAKAIGDSLYTLFEKILIFCLQNGKLNNSSMNFGCNPPVKIRSGMDARYNSSTKTRKKGNKNRR